MLMVADIKEDLRRKLSIEEENYFGIDKLNTVRSTISAVTHVDYSARLQTVNKKQNPEFHSLISAFKKLTGCAVLINTSFNIRGEPIVCSPYDAFKCFMGTDLDILIIGNCVLEKNQQNAQLIKDYRDQFQLD